MAYWMSSVEDPEPPAFARGERRGDGVGAMASGRASWRWRGGVAAAMASSVSVAAMAWGRGVRYGPYAIEGRKETRAQTVEDEVDGLLVLPTKLLGDELLRVVEDLGLEAHVARRVDAVDVAEGRRDGELAVRHLAQRFIHLPDLLGLRVELRRVDVGVVDAVFFSTGDAELHL